MLLLLSLLYLCLFFFFSSRRRHTRLVSDWSSDVCSSDLDCFLAPIACRNFIASRDSCRNSSQDLVREAGFGVGFEDDVGYAPQPGSEQHGTCSISADAKRGDGLVLA